MKRITKSEAKKLFAEGKEVILCPCKMVLDRPWNMGCPITSGEWVERIKTLYPDEQKPIDRAWETMYNSWAYYNTDNERGTYAHYYIRA